MRVAILPAGGKEERMERKYLAPKQLLPLKNGAVIDYSLEAALRARCNYHVIIPKYSHAVAAYVAKRTQQPRLAFSYAEENQLDSMRALSDLYQKDMVFFMMPDTVFKPLEICSWMAHNMKYHHTPVTVALFETTETHRFGMAHFKANEQTKGISSFKDKPEEWLEPIGWAWGIIGWQGGALWKSLYLTSGETMTDVLNHYILDGGHIQHLHLTSYRDIGTPEDYEKAQAEGW